MTRYKILVRRQVLKAIEHIGKPFSNKIKDAIDGLAENPKPFGYIKLKDETEDIYRIRVGDYRILYSIDDVVRIVEIRNVGNRKDIYDLL